ncbi:hypothetical protein TNCV_4945521 [Trichonephila clavipes]|nr:hypothetical protein TNCV_4945521 [Trichonephila clavipes]
MEYRLSEYSPTERKWMIEKDNVMCGTMVIVKEDFTPVCNWLLGRVVEVNHGSDGVDSEVYFGEFSDKSTNGWIEDHQHNLESLCHFEEYPFVVSAKVSGRNLKELRFSRSEDFINEALDDAASVMNLTEEEEKIRITTHNMSSKHIHLRSSPLERRYTSANVRITSGSTAGTHFMQPSARSTVMLLSPYLMTQNAVPVNIFSLMGTGKSHAGLSLVNRGSMEARECEFSRGTLLLIGIDVLVRCHAEDTSCHSARTEAAYEEWIPSNDIFKKCVSSAILTSV